MQSRRTKSGERSEMNADELTQWAKDNGDGSVERRSDNVLSLNGQLIRFRWNGGLALGVGREAPGKVRINAVLDGISWFSSIAESSDTTLHLVLGSGETDSESSLRREQLDAIGTLVCELRSGPDVRVWSVLPNGQVNEIPSSPARFIDTGAPRRWNRMLMAAAVAPISGMASDFVQTVNHPSLALYPKLSSLSSARPWQIRLDGLEVGRIGSNSASLGLATRNLEAPGEPRATWRSVVGCESLVFDSEQLQKMTNVIHQLIAQWTDSEHPEAVLRHGQAEHALEAHVLSGRLQLSATEGPLKLAVPFRSGMLGAAQFPPCGATYRNRGPLSGCPVS